MMRARTKVALGAAATAFALALTLLLTPASAGFTAGVRNNANSLGTGTAFLTASQGSTALCSSVPSGNLVPATAAFPCTGDLLPAQLLPGGVSSQTTTLTPSGSAPATTGTLTFNSCGVAQLGNTLDAPHALLPRYGVSYEQAGPYSNSKATGFNGVDTLATGTVKSNNLSTFTMGIWFKTATPQGALFGFTNNSSAAAPTAVNNQLYMSSNGRLNFSSVNSGTIRTVTSTASYADNRWHYATIVGTSGLLFGLQSNLTLYVDNQRVATTTFFGGQLSDARQGFWRVGHSASTGSYPGNGQYFNGSLANFTVAERALTAAQVGRLATATSQEQYEQRLPEVGANEHWALDDSGRELYTGVTPEGEPQPCTQVQATVGAAASCLLPARSTACTATTSAATLASLSGSALNNVPLGTPAAPERLTLTLNRSSGFNSWSNGLHLRMDTSLSVAGFPQNFQWTDNEMVIA